MHAVPERGRFPPTAVVLAVFWLSLFLSTSSAQRDPAIVKGPYLQCPTPASMTVMWETSVPCTGKVVFYDESGQERTAAETSVCALHEVVLTGLAPGTAYRYRVVSSDGTSSVSSPSYRFRTVPVEMENWRFIVRADVVSGRDAVAHESMVNLLSRTLRTDPPPACVIATGDLVDDGAVYEHWAEQFFAPEGKLYASTPLWPCLGNHENDGIWYFRFFSLPGNERWYSFDYLNSHFIALDSFSDLTPEGAQYRWLEQDLRTTRADWVFVFFHAPPYSSGGHNYLDSAGVPAEKAVHHAQVYLDPLFQKYGVTAVFSGHNHCYERSRKGRVFYFVAGSMGGRVRGAVVANPYVQVFRKSYSFLIVEMGQNTARVQAQDIRGRIIDSVELSPRQKGRVAGAPSSEPAGAVTK